MGIKPPYLFISYRRDDTQWIARAIYRHFAERFGPHCVFMDRVEIRGGDDWRTAIATALNDATSLLALIGQSWLRLTDLDGRRRIDKDDDWVCDEIRQALNHRKQLIPLYVDGAQPIVDPAKLPSDLARFVDVQAINVSGDFWDAGLQEAVRRLEARGFRSSESAVAMPERREKVEPLTPVQLEESLQQSSGWSVTATMVSTRRGEPAIPRNELYKEFRFLSFCDTTRFMAETSPLIDAGQHHPRDGRMFGLPFVYGSVPGTSNSNPRPTMSS
jgi:pterin-4a-carbinolamine dehydratase